MSVTDGERQTEIAKCVPAQAAASQACNIVTSARAPTDVEALADPVASALSLASERWAEVADARALRRSLLGVLQLLDDSEA